MLRRGEFGNCASTDLTAADTKGSAVIALCATSFSPVTDTQMGSFTYSGAILAERPCRGDDIREVSRGELLHSIDAVIADGVVAALPSLVLTSAHSTLYSLINSCGDSKDMICSSSLTESSSSRFDDREKRPRLLPCHRPEENRLKEFA